MIQSECHCPPDNRRHVESCQQEPTWKGRVQGHLDPSKSQWCEDERGLDFYGFKSGTELIYRDKHRYLRVKMLDGAVKTVLVCMRH